MRELRRICVYAGSTRRDPAYARPPPTWRDALWSSGSASSTAVGAVGLMGVLADTALEAGGEVIGVIPRDLADREIGHRGLTELHVVASMHERKALMADLSDGFIALPGGAGTLEELVEVYTWSQLGLHAKPMGVLDVNAYYGRLAALLDHAVEEGFLRREHRAALHFSADPEVLLEHFAGWQPQPVGKWLDR
jgi:uncharacterized protein (TIGR00730 family)